MGLSSIALKPQKNEAISSLQLKHSRKLMRINGTTWDDLENTWKDLHVLWPESG